MTQWEYKTYLFEPDDKVVEILNKLGAEGWEAWHVQYGKSGAVRMFFKRPKATP